MGGKGRVAYHGGSTHALLGWQVAGRAWWREQLQVTPLAPSYTGWADDSLNTMNKGLKINIDPQGPFDFQLSSFLVVVPNRY